MTAQSLSIPADKLIGNVGRDREINGSESVKLRLGESFVAGPMTVRGTATGTADGVMVKFEASAEAELSCTRCLTTWPEKLDVVGEQHFRTEPDEDGYAIVDGEIDVAAPAKDELALSIPATPLCQDGCLGLCPTCGTDLNREPCDGHGEDSDSPFTVLRDLFDS